MENNKEINGPEEAAVAEEQNSEPKEYKDFRLAGIRLRPGWPVQHFCVPPELTVTDGEWVVVPTDHGDEVGVVCGAPLNVTLATDSVPPFISRLASTYEIECYYANLDREKGAWNLCMERIEAHKLSMKLVRVESFFDGSKIIFYYSAEGRVDFRELVKDLVKGLRTRVEMRQIGVRHEAKMTGGLGNCGRPLCCASFLSTFDPISIKMAKAQNLPLNPNKISGLCGRLLCCLTFEFDTYVELARGIPQMGKQCVTPAGEGKVIRQNILKQTVTVALPEGEQEFSAEDLLKHQEELTKKTEQIEPESQKTHEKEKSVKKEKEISGKRRSKTRKKRGRRRRSKAKAKSDKRPQKG